MDMLDRRDGEAVGRPWISYTLTKRVELGRGRLAIRTERMKIRKDARKVKKICGKVKCGKIAS